MPSAAYKTEYKTDTAKMMELLYQVIKWIKSSGINEDGTWMIILLEKDVINSITEKMLWLLQLTISVALFFFFFPSLPRLDDKELLFLSVKSVNF